MNQDNFFMKKAIELAKQGRGRSGPNPLSGAIVVQDGEIVGEGFYSGTNSEHAEYHAIKAAKGKTDGATLYVVVEPCFSKGRNTSCQDYIKLAGIKRVVVAMEDPNISIKGKGLNALFDDKIEISFGIEEEVAKKLNEHLIKYYATRLPYVNMVSLMTLDGKINTVLGDKEWIIGNDSRNALHELRAGYDAILVGVNTIIKDNPQLSCKIQGGRDPVKIVVDTYGKTPPNSKVFIKSKRDDHRPNLIIAVSAHVTEERIKNLTAAGAEVIVCADEKYDDEKYSKVDLKKLIYQLGKKGYTSLLVESGGNLNAALLEEDLIDRVSFFITPRIVGGKDALTPVEGTGISLMSEALELKNVSYTKLGNEMLVEGYLK